MTAYSQQTYLHFDEDRSLQEKVHQHRVVQQIVENNLKSLKIELTPKKKTSYQPRQREKIQLGDGWFCYITDNNLNRSNCVLTLHGAPGDHVQWAGLEHEMEEHCRWINLTFPGFDGEDERRGDYDGSADHVSQLILRLMKRLNLQQIIICAHSLGSIFCSYFITKYPEAVKGYINVTGIVDHWYIGIMTFFRLTIAENGFNSKEWRQKKLYDDDNSRAIIYNIFLNNAEGRRFGPVQFPKLTKTEYFAYIKLINSMPNGVSQLYSLNQRLKILRVLIFGKKDPLHDWFTTEASIYNLCRGQSYITLPYYQRLFESAKEQVQQRLRDQFGIEVDGRKLQEYFCFHFADTGHNAHKRRPKEMSRIMKIYMACLDVLEKYAWIAETCL